MKFDITSPNRFFESVSSALSEKARASVMELKDAMVEDTKVETEDPDELSILRNLADSVKLGYSIEVEDGESSFVIDDDNDQDVIDEFFNLVDDQGIEFEIESDDEDEYDDEIDYDASIDEARLLKRTKPLDKLKRKQKYRKNKAKIKLSQKKFRRTSKFKKFNVKQKRLNKLGKTSTGKRQTRRS